MITIFSSQKYHIIEASNALSLNFLKPEIL